MVTESADLQAFIDNVEAETLKSLLGIELYTALIAGLAEDPVPAKWTKLRDGDVYTYGSKQYEYRGLIKLLVPCIYSAWLQENRDKFTSSGTVITSNKDVDHVSPAWRIVNSYNSFSREAGASWAQCGTLYGFLINSVYDYGTLIFNEPGFKNEFGL